MAATADTPFARGGQLSAVVVLTRIQRLVVAMKDLTRQNFSAGAVLPMAVLHDLSTTGSSFASSARLLVDSKYDYVPPNSN